MSESHPYLLLVEDNPGDVVLIQEALADLDEDYRLEVATNGEAALELLRNRSELPSLVLLDLNLPRLSGRELLSNIKADPRLKTLPVLVLSSSDHDDDVEAVYALHANGYLVKPDDIETLTHCMRAVESFWLQTVTLPA